MPRFRLRRWQLAAAVLALLLITAWLFAKARGPELPGYTVEAGPVVQTVVATGRVAAPSRVQVGAEIAGLVVARHVMEGDRVAPGDLLVELRAQDLQAQRDEAAAALAALREAELPDARARLREARARLAQAERELARRRELGERQLVTREQIEQAVQAEIAARAAAEQAQLAVEALAGGARETQARERLAAAEAALARAEVRATVAGTVLTRGVEPGDIVRAGDVLFEIARDDPGELRIPLDEKNLARIAVGQPATGIADAFPDRPFAATVHHIAPAVDPSRGTVDVRLRFGNEVDFLRQDMTVTATITTGEAADALVVPDDALLEVDEGRGTALVLRVRDGRVQRVPVKLGLRGLAMSEVREGLQAGDRVLAATALARDALPAEGDRVRIDEQPAPKTGADRSRGELPVQLD
ncbi:efflux RND transporter periplasmic adaptor subunit [Arenimonas composti]|uniref:Uncharacterized protein n=1 Tax=Arenimonas composti TR7-09 = DSM 18010 TaxID=1121013 RepID=A0A091C0B2_9GAMM|nr:efflux RND transporter periplasmic adaptor subunit [Arenimonas composti]KFN50060.1 hypothetical protein P873_08455 [Arenimonas composti TR7-09 = DSM 18010]